MSSKIKSDPNPQIVGITDKSLIGFKIAAFTAMGVMVIIAIIGCIR